MIKLVMINGATLYTKESYTQMEHMLRGGKTGCIHGFEDEQGTKPVLIQFHNIVYVKE